MEDECDDGNTDDGDGCSSTCHIQIGYQCEVSNSSSSCTYLQKGIQASLVRINRVGKKQEVTFVFALVPNPLTSSTFSKANHLFSLNLEDSTVLDAVWTYSDGELIATSPFYSNIEGKNVMANFTFDQKFVKNDPLFLNFTILSSNIKLQYFEDISKIVTFNDVMLGICCAGLVLLLVGSFLHKMVGV